MRDRAFAVGMEGLERSKAKHERELRQLTPIAWYLAQNARRKRLDGVTVSELRVVGQRPDFAIIPNHLPPGSKELSYLGGVMRRARLRNTGRNRRSFLEVTHGIRQTIWEAPDD